MREEDVLGAFAMEEDVTRATLKRYIDCFPKHAEALLDLYHDLEMSSLQESETLATARTNADSLSSAEVPQAVMSGDQIKAVSKELGIPRTFFTGLRDHRVRFGTIPSAFLIKLAALLRIRLDVLVAYLASPSAGKTALAFRADRAPTTKAQLSFDDYVAEAVLTDGQRRAVEALL